MNDQQSFPQKRGPWTVTATREVYKTDWLRLREDAILWPNGTSSTWAVVEFPQAVGVVALSEDRRVHLVGQHRYATNRFEWEVPAGCIDPGEDLLDAAKRELREETGLSASQWTPLGATHPLNGSCDATYYLFIAQSLTHGASAPEATELLTHKTMPFDEALKQVQSGEMMDGLTQVAIYRAWHWINSLSQQNVL